MRSFNFQYSDIGSLTFFITTNLIDKGDNVLVQLFDGLLDSKKALSLASSLKEMLPNSNIIGTSTCGEISDGEMYENSLNISFTLFDSTVVRSKLYELDKNFKAEKIAKELICNDTKALIVFSDGLQSNTELLLRELYAMKPEMIIAGGRAGDNLEFKKTYVFDDKNYNENACVIATLSGEDLIVNSDYMLNWMPIGKDMLVTKVNNNILYELDHIPIVEIYKKYLGDDIANNLPAACLEFPLIIKKGSLDIARDPISQTEDGALVFAGNFELGDIVRFSFGNIESVADDSQKNFDKFSKIPAESIFVYSCAARKSLLGETLKIELNILESISTTTGFFTYGEYFHTSNIVEILNVTTTFIILSESSKVIKKRLKKPDLKETDLSKKALTHLIRVTAKELEHVSTHDVLTSLYNRAEYIKRIAIKMKSAQRYKEHFGLILVDIDYFKLVNDNYGHVVGDDVLRKLAKLLLDNVREDDFVARWGGEEFVLILNYATMDDLERLVKKFQAKVEKLSFAPVPKLTLSFGLSVYIDGDSEDSLFKRVDNALYTAKNSGRNCYVIG